jgi:hypothetical protein
LLLVTIVIVGRIVPHPLNFTPLLAVGMLCGMIYKSNTVAFLAMIFALVMSDFIIGTDSSLMHMVIYTSMVVPALLGKFIQPKQLAKASVLTMVGTLFFFTTTNFAVWCLSDMYPHNLEGLRECYLMAIPFLKNSILGDQFWTILLIGAYSYAPILLRQPHLNWGQVQLSK